MLADGYLLKAKPEHNTRLRIDHTYPCQEAYVISIYNLFKPMVKMEPTIVERKADKRTGKIYKSIYFWSLSFPCLNPYYFLFYNNKTKKVPINIEELLTARGLAHWVMGDGFYMTSQGVIVLCTDSYTKGEINLLIAALNNKFGIKATLNKRVSSAGLNSWRIRISKKSMKQITTIVDPYIIREFRYKLGESNKNNSDMN